jgi:hypothetical protein
MGVRFMRGKPVFAVLVLFIVLIAGFLSLLFLSVSDVHSKTGSGLLEAGSAMSCGNIGYGLEETWGKSTVVSTSNLVVATRYAKEWKDFFAQGRYWIMYSNGTPPTANFMYSPSYIQANATVTFNASPSEPGSGTIISYRWDFGDGTRASLTTPVTTHVYSTAGQFTVWLTVVNSYGASANTSQTITILNVTLITLTVGDYDRRADVNSTVLIPFRISSNGVPVAHYSVQFNHFIWLESDGAGNIYYPLYSSAVGVQYVEVTGVKPSLNFIPPETCSVIFDFVNITYTLPQHVFNQQHPATLTPVVNATYAYDGEPFDGTIMWNQNLTQYIGHYQYFVAGINDRKYGLTRFVAPPPQEVVFEYLTFSETCSVDWWGNVWVNVTFYYLPDHRTANFTIHSDLSLDYGSSCVLHSWLYAMGSVEFRVKDGSYASAKFVVDTPAPNILLFYFIYMALALIIIAYLLLKKWWKKLGEGRNNEEGRKLKC